MKLLPLLSLLFFSVLLHAQKQEWINEVEGGGYTWPYGLQVDAYGNSYMMYSYSIAWYLPEVTRINKYDPYGELVNSTVVDSGGALQGIIRDFKLASDSTFRIILYNGHYVGVGIMTQQGELLSSTLADAGSDTYFIGSSIDGNDNTYLVVSAGNSNSRPAITKFSSYGAFAWTNTYDPPYAADINDAVMCVDESGNVYSTQSYWINDGSVIWKMVTIKYNAEGDLQWEQEEDFDHSVLGYAITCKDGKIFVVTSVTDTTSDLLIYCYSEDGNALWAQQYINPYTDAGWIVPTEIICDNNGHVDAFGRFDDKILTLQLSTDGEIIWSDPYSYIASRWAYMNDAAVDADGNIVIAGKEAPEFSGDYNFWVMKYSSMGGHLWSVAYTSNPNVMSEDYIFYVQFDSDGNIIVCGQVDLDSSNGSDYDGNMATVAKYVDTIAVSVPPVEEAEHAPWVVYPSPASEVIFIRGNFDANKFFITDLSGRKIECNRITGKNAFDIRSLSHGIYLLHSIRNSDVVKFVKQ